jgi:hypothetical protein
MASTHVPSTNIGTHPEDVPRNLNTDFGGDGSPTDRLWKRYRTELAQRDKRNTATPETGGKAVGAVRLSHALRSWLRRLVARPA